MSHMRAKAVEIVLASVEHAMGTAEQRMHAWPLPVTEFGYQQIGDLTPRERQILLWELGTLLERIKEINVDPVDAPSDFPINYEGMPDGATASLMNTSLMKAVIIGLVLHTYGDLPKEQMARKLSNYGFTDEEVEALMSPVEVADVPSR